VVVPILIIGYILFGQLILDLDKRGQIKLWPIALQTANLTVVN